MAFLESFQVPDFRLPFESGKHPQGGGANAEATEWAAGHALVNQAAAGEFAGIGFGHLAGRVSQEASYGHLVTFAQWMAWSFVLDDQHDHLIRSGRLDAWSPVTDAIRAHVAGEKIPRHPRNPLVGAFIDVWDRAVAGMPMGIRGRCEVHIREMLRSLDQEAANRTAVVPPTITDYILTRRHSSQLLPMLDMSEAALGIEVPWEIYASPVFQELIWSAVDVISWGNDVFSLRKESSCGDNNNIAFLLAQRYRWSLPQVVRVVQRRIAARVEDFLAAEQRLPRALEALSVTDASSRAAAVKCAQNYRDWMIGADLWQRYECTRYSDERWVAGLEGAYTRPDLVCVA